MKRRTLLGYSLLFIGGCTAAKSRDTTGASTSGVQKPEKLRFAVTDILELKKLQRDYEAFRKTLEEVLETKIEFFPVANRTGAASALQLNQVDLVLAGPSEYVVIRARTNANPAIAITRPNYHSLIAVPANSSIQSVSDLKGKKIALSDIGSTSGHLGPINMLMDAGLDPKSDLEVLMLGDEGSAEALKKDEVDAWGGSFGDYQRLLSASEFPVMIKGPSLPSDVLIVSKQLSPEFVTEMQSRMVENQAKLIQALLVGEDTQKYKNSQLVAAKDEDYNMIREVYQAIGQGDVILAPQ